MESFRSKQFKSEASGGAIQPMKLFSHTRKLYPELSSILDLEAKQEKLRRLKEKPKIIGSLDPP